MPCETIDAAIWARAKTACATLRSSDADGLPGNVQIFTAASEGDGASAMHAASMPAARMEWRG
jgi:hypothetical protein